MVWKQRRPEADLRSGPSNVPEANPVTAVAATVAKDTAMLDNGKVWSVSGESESSSYCSASSDVETDAGSPVVAEAEADWSPLPEAREEVEDRDTLWHEEVAAIAQTLTAVAEAKNRPRAKKRRSRSRRNGCRRKKSQPQVETVMICSLKSSGSLSRRRVKS